MAVRNRTTLGTLANGASIALAILAILVIVRVYQDDWQGVLNPTWFIFFGAVALAVLSTWLKKRDAAHGDVWQV